MIRRLLVGKISSKKLINQIIFPNQIDENSILVGIFLRFLYQKEIFQLILPYYFILITYLVGRPITLQKFYL